MAKTNIDLHVHPYPENYTPYSIVKALEKNDVKILGIPFYNTFNDEKFNLIAKDSKNLLEYSAEVGDILIKLKNLLTGKETYLLKAREIMNQENLHLLAIGNTSRLTPHVQYMKNIETGIKNDAVVIIDHPFANADHEYKPINGEKKRLLEEIAKEFQDEVAWEWNGYCIPWLRKGILDLMSLTGISYERGLAGADVNKELENFAREMKEKGCKINIVADSDIHARTPGALKEIGKAGHIRIDESKIDFSSEEKMLSSIKNTIKQGEGIGYENHKNYVSFGHLARYFGIPAALNLARRRG